MRVEWATAVFTNIFGNVKVKFLFVFVFLMASTSFGQDFRSFAKGGDLLGLRVLLKKNIRKIKKNPKLWNETYGLIIENPGVGVDLLIRWPKFRPQRKGKKREKKIHSILSKADKAMLAENYKKAAKIYQRALKSFNRKNYDKDTINNYLYFHTLHMLARAFYGNKQFEEATTVYEWIYPKYPHFRQVLFEKMWASFLWGRNDIALGAVASMRSSYFSEFLPPEVYLVQIYIYKQLCRNSDIAQVLDSIRRYKKKVRKKNRTNITEWAKTRMEYLSLARLLEAEDNPYSTRVVNRGQRKKERKKLRKKLRSMFKKNKKKLLAELEKVENFSQLAKLASQKVLPNPLEEFSYSGLLSEGYEMWPVESGEDWLDELGKHKFLGRSECGT